MWWDLMSVHYQVLWIMEELPTVNRLLLNNNKPSFTTFLTVSFLLMTPNRIRNKDIRVNAFALILIKVNWNKYSFIFHFRRRSSKCRSKYNESGLESYICSVSLPGLAPLQAYENYSYRNSGSCCISTE